MCVEMFPLHANACLKILCVRASAPVPAYLVCAVGYKSCALLCICACKVCEICACPSCRHLQMRPHCSDKLTFDFVTILYPAHHFGPSLGCNQAVATACPKCRRPTSGAMTAYSKLACAPKKKNGEDHEERASRLALVGVATRSRGLLKKCTEALKLHPEALPSVYHLLKDLGCFDAAPKKGAKTKKRLADDKNITAVHKLYVNDLMEILSHCEPAAMSKENLKTMFAWFKKTKHMNSKEVILHILEYISGMPPDEPLTPAMRYLDFLKKYVKEASDARHRPGMELSVPVDFEDEHVHYWVLYDDETGAPFLHSTFFDDAVDLWHALPKSWGRPDGAVIEVKLGFSWERA